MSQPIHTFYAQGPGPPPWDWEAYRNGFEPGDPVGHGETERDAILDLLEREAEREETPTLVQCRKCGVIRSFGTPACLCGERSWRVANAAE